MAIGLHLKCCECNILSKTQRWKGWSGGRLEDARGFSWKYLGGNSASPPRRRLKKHTRHSRLFFLPCARKVTVLPFKRKQQQREAVKFAAESETITWGLQGDVSAANIIQGCLTSVTPQLFPAERSLFEHLQPASLSHTKSGARSERFRTV